MTWYSLLKFVHVLLAITAVGSNITYAAWNIRGAMEPQHLSFALRGVKFLDNLNPARLRAAGRAGAAVRHRQRRSVASRRPRPTRTRPVVASSARRTRSRRRKSPIRATTIA